MTENAHRTTVDSPQPDIPYLRRLMADALDKGEPVLIFPPESSSFIDEEMGLDPADLARTGYVQLGPEDEGDPMVRALLVHPARGEHLTSDLITGSLTLTEREEDRS